MYLEPGCRKNGERRNVLEKEAPDYCFQSLYLQNEDELGDALECEELDGIRTIVTRESQTSDEPIVSFAGEEVTLQRATGDGVNHTFMDDFRQRCIQTALGYSNTVWDLLAAAYPEKRMMRGRSFRRKQRLISVLIRNRLRHLMRQRSQRAIRG